MIINDGDEIPIESGEILELGDLSIDKIVVKEKNATIKFLGVE